MDLRTRLNQLLHATEPRTKRIQPGKAMTRAQREERRRHFVMDLVFAERLVVAEEFYQRLTGNRFAWRLGSYPLLEALSDEDLMAFAVRRRALCEQAARKFYPKWDGARALLAPGEKAPEAQAWIAENTEPRDVALVAEVSELRNSCERRAEQPPAAAEITTEMTTADQTTVPEPEPEPAPIAGRIGVPRVRRAPVVADDAARFIETIPRPIESVVGIGNETYMTDRLGRLTG